MEAVVSAKDLVVAIAHLDAFSSLKNPLRLIDVLLEGEFLDCRGITPQLSPTPAIQLHSMATFITGSAEVCVCVASVDGGPLVGG